jgi:TfoX/Sxy family transcriptional regulator of competence genes
MAYDKGVAERLREVYEDVPNVVEKKMFGGVAFMVDGHMSCGVNQESIMVRVGPAQYADALKKPHAREMDFTGKPLKGFVYIDPDGFESDEALISWVKLSLDFVATLPSKRPL